MEAGKFTDEKGLNHEGIVMYCTAVCPYCVSAEQLLVERGVKHINKIRVDIDLTKREEMIDLTGKTSVPQIFISGNYIGGCDDLYELDSIGRLLPMLDPA